MEQPVSTPVQGPARSAELEARIGTGTDLGRVRGNNEDRLVVFDLFLRRALAEDGATLTALQPPGVVLIVADGMGGMMAGEQASQMCIELLPACLVRRLEERPGPTESDERRGLFSEALRETHGEIYARAGSRADLKGMGTTCTAAWLDGRDMLIAQVGDSRAYRYRGGEVVQLTRDQTVWEKMRGATENPAEVFAKAPWKNMLVQALGAQEELQAVCTAHEVEPGDWLLLCSDGLYRVVGPQEMAAVMGASSGPAEKARELVAVANRNGGPDNVSVILCQVAELSGAWRRVEAEG